MAFFSKDDDFGLDDQNTFLKQTKIPYELNPLNLQRDADIARLNRESANRYELQRRELEEQNKAFGGSSATFWRNPSPTTREANPIVKADLNKRQYDDKAPVDPRIFTAGPNDAATPSTPITNEPVAQTAPITPSAQTAGDQFSQKGIIKFSRLTIRVSWTYTIRCTHRITTYHISSITNIHNAFL